MTVSWPGQRDPVVIADDQQLVRAGFRVLLEAEDGVEVVGEVGDGAAALELVRSERPDVVLMDIRMSGVDGLEATPAISDDEDLQDAKVLILTTFELDEYVFDALRAGAAGFLVKRHRAGRAGARRPRRRGGRVVAVAERHAPVHRRVHVETEPR